MTMAEAIDLAEAAHPSSPRTIYVVMRQRGDFSDREVECFKAFINEDEAKLLVDRLDRDRDRLFSIVPVIRFDSRYFIFDDDDYDINDYYKPKIERKNLLNTPDFEFFKPAATWEYTNGSSDIDPEVKFFIQEVKLIT